MKKNIFDSKYVTKKKSGVSSSFLMVFMAVLGVFIMMIMDVNFNTNHNRIRKVTQIEREYLLLMESDGCLPMADMTNLRQKLIDLGYVENISISAPTSPVTYGEEIVLQIDCDVQFEDVEIKDLFHISKKPFMVRKTFKEETTAKH